MGTLKKEAPVLVSLDFSPLGLQIFLNVDASTSISWGGKGGLSYRSSRAMEAFILQGIRVEYSLMQRENMMR